MVSSMFLESKAEDNKTVSSSSATLFAVPSLKCILFEKLQVSQGNLQGLLKYIENDLEFSGFERDALRFAVRLKLIRDLLQAVVDNDHQTVKVILNFNPKLLLANPQDEGVIEVESKKTWQKFRAEPVIKIAFKRNQLEMVKLLLPYFDMLDNGKAEAATQLTSPEKPEEKHEHYNEILQPLINAIANESFPNGMKHGNLSIETEKLLETFRNTMLPVKAVILDEYFDIEQFLSAGYAAYEKNFKKFRNWWQRDIFRIRVLGFLQSLVSPELGKIFCEGLCSVIEKNTEISERAAGLSLPYSDPFCRFFEKPFYRESSSSCSGLGFDFFASYTGNVDDGGMGGETWWHSNGVVDHPPSFNPGASAALKKYIDQKQHDLAQHKSYLKIPYKKVEAAVMNVAPLSPYLPAARREVGFDAPQSASSSSCAPSAPEYPALSSSVSASSASSFSARQAPTFFHAEPVMSAVVAPLADEVKMELSPEHARLKRSVIEGIKNHLIALGFEPKPRQWDGGSNGFSMMFFVIIANAVGSAIAPYNNIKVIEGPKNNAMHAVLKNAIEALEMLNPAILDQAKRTHAGQYDLVKPWLFGERSLSGSSYASFASNVGTVSNQPGWHVAQLLQKVEEAFVAFGLRPQHGRSRKAQSRHIPNLG